MINIIPDPTIINICCNKYNEKEIRAARDILCSSLIHDQLQPEFSKRQTKGINETPETKYAAEIFQLFQEYGTSEEMRTYAAINLSNLPIIKYESTDISGLLLSHNKLEHKVIYLTDRIQHCTKIIEQLVDNQTVLVESAGSSNLQDKQSFQCDNTFDREADLRTHVTTHTESLACSECENKSHCETELCAHMTSHKKTLNCSECDTTFNNESESITHSTSHKREHYCPECDFTCANHTEMDAHMVAHKKPFHCNKCGKNTFDNESDFGSHMLSHIAEHDHNTDHTANKGKTINTLYDNTQEKTGILSYEKSFSGSRANSCSFCEYETEDKINFMKHMASHKDVKPFVCKLEQ